VAAGSPESRRSPTTWPQPRPKLRAIHQRHLQLPAHPGWPREIVRRRVAKGAAKPLRGGRPRDDIDAVDAGDKLCVLLRLASTWPARRADPPAGYPRLDARDSPYGRELGYVLKLLASRAAADSGVEGPRAPRSSCPRASRWRVWTAAYNAVHVIGDLCGPVMFSGLGGGGDATASACWQTWCTSSRWRWATLLESDDGMPVQRDTMKATPSSLIVGRCVCRSFSRLPACAGSRPAARAPGHAAPPLSRNSDRGPRSLVAVDVLELGLERRDFPVGHLLARRARAPARRSRRSPCRAGSGGDASAPIVLAAASRVSSGMITRVVALVGACASLQDLDGLVHGRRSTITVSKRRSSAPSFRCTCGIVERRRAHALSSTRASRRFSMLDASTAFRRA